MSGVNKVSVGVVERNAPDRGPTSSEDFNATMQEIRNSLTQFSLVLNNEIQPLLDTLPGGLTSINPDERTSIPDPFKNGFDGSQIYTDLTATEVSDDGRFYDEKKERPLVIKETFNKIQTQLNASIQELEVKIAQIGESAGISPRQKQALGSRIFDPGTESAESSIDGRLGELQKNLDQLGLDFSGDSDFLNASGTQSLLYSFSEQLKAIQESHDYDKNFNQMTHAHLEYHAHRYHISPQGLIDGENRDYDLPDGEKFIANTLRVMVNGIEIRKTNHYTEAPDCTGFTITESFGALEDDGLESDDMIWIHYDVEATGEQ